MKPDAVATVVENFKQFYTKIKSLLNFKILNWVKIVYE